MSSVWNLMLQQLKQRSENNHKADYRMLQQVWLLGIKHTTFLSMNSCYYASVLIIQKSRIKKTLPTQCLIIEKMLCFFISYKESIFCETSFVRRRQNEVSLYTVVCRLSRRCVTNLKPYSKFETLACILMGVNGALSLV